MPRVKGYSDDEVQLGKIIREFRICRGLARETVAEKLGITHQQLQKYETGRNRICATRLKKICEILGISYETALGGCDLRISGAERLTLEVSQNFSKIKNRNLKTSVLQLINSIVKNEASEGRRR